MPNGRADLLVGQDARQRVPTGKNFMNFEFATATRIIFGAGSLREAGALAGEFGARALVVTGRDTKRAEPLLKILHDTGVGTTTFSVAGEPELSTVEQGTALAKAGRCELVIGFGGGSVLDAAKAIAAMLANGGGLLDYVEIIGRGQGIDEIVRAIHRDSNDGGDRFGSHAQRRAGVTGTQIESQPAQSADAGEGRPR